MAFAAEPRDTERTRIVGMVAVHARRWAPAASAEKRGNEAAFPPGAAIGSVGVFAEFDMSCVEHPGSLKA